MHDTEHFRDKMSVHIRHMALMHNMEHFRNKMSVHIGHIKSIKHTKGEIHL